MYDMLSEFRVSEFDSFVDILKLTPGDPLDTFGEMWYPVFLWSLFSSVFVHTCAALVAFGTLRKHKYGKFFPVLLIVMGVVSPVTSGVATSAAVAFIYRAANLTMPPIHAMIWGIGQTVLGAGMGFTRILATL
ncbi:transmembrane protein 170A [Anticarsia gemmatalis]|uniref:transmembrane protein 170A n=1 Tax=Anticarsia gemmatalis TaxID=129554 RepID=UPI0021257C83